jgi:ADP-heptose:LPS heptosyltransferase
MRGQGYDLIVSLQEKSTFYAWCAFLLSLGGPRRPVTVALDHPRTRRWYQHVSPVVPDQHEVYKYLGVARLLGCPRERSPVLELEPTLVARKRVAIRLEQFGASADTRFIGINPGGTKPEKRWSVDGFAQVARRLQEALRLPVAVLGGACDVERAQRIAEQLPEPPLITAGWATLGDTAAVLERCAVVVTNDTGPMHMAVALAIPVAALFGPTSPTKFGPFSRQARVLHHQEPCSRCQRPCLHTVTVEEVVEAVLGLYRPLASGAAREDGR